MNSKEVQGSWAKVSNAHKGDDASKKKSSQGYTTEHQYMKAYRKLQSEKILVKSYHRYVKFSVPRSKHTQEFWAIQSAGAINNMQLLIDGKFISRYALKGSKALRTPQREKKYDRKAVNAYDGIAGNEDLRKAYMLMDFIEGSHVLDDKLTPEQRDLKFHKQFSKDSREFHKKTNKGLDTLVNSSIESKAKKLAPRGYSIDGAKARILHEALSQRHRDGGLYKRYFKWFNESPKTYKDIYPSSKTVNQYRKEASKAKHPMAYAQMAGGILSIQKHKGMTVSEARNVMMTGLKRTAKKGFSPKKNLSLKEQRDGFRCYCETLDEFDQNHQLGQYANSKSRSQSHDYSKDRDKSVHFGNDQSRGKSHDTDKDAEMDDDDGLDM